MTAENFRLQIERLSKVYNSKNTKYYEGERVGLFWKAFQHTDDMVFAEAVDDLIANRKSAPMLDDIEEAVQEARVRDRQRRQVPSRNQIQMLQDASNAATDPKVKEFSRACIKLLHDKVTGRITKEQFLQGCDMMDRAAIQGRQGMCARCCNTGFLLVRNKDYDYLHRCGCQEGRAQPEELILTRQDGSTESAKVPLAPYRSAP